MLKEIQNLNVVELPKDELKMEPDQSINDIETADDEPPAKKPKSLFGISTEEIIIKEEVKELETCNFFDEDDDYDMSQLDDVEMAADNIDEKIVKEELLTSGWETMQEGTMNESQVDYVDTSQLPMITNEAGKEVRN